jgi:hypothetical protein
MVCIIWNVFQNVVAQNHIVLIVFKGKLQISAFTSAKGENKSVVGNLSFFACGTIYKKLVLEQNARLFWRCKKSVVR